MMTNCQLLSNIMFRAVILAVLSSLNFLSSSMVFLFCIWYISLYKAIIIEMSGRWLVCRYLHISWLEKTELKRLYHFLLDYLGISRITLAGRMLYISQSNLQCCHICRLSVRVLFVPDTGSTIMTALWQGKQNTRNPIVIWKLAKFHCQAVTAVLEYHYRFLAMFQILVIVYPSVFVKWRCVRETTSEVLFIGLMFLAICSNLSVKDNIYCRVFISPFASAVLKLLIISSSVLFIVVYIVPRWLVGRYLYFIFITENPLW